MLNLGQMITLLMTLIIFGMGAPKALGFIEKKMASFAVEAYRSGYISIGDFNNKLTKGELNQQRSKLKH